MFLINHHSISHNGIGTNRIASLLYRIPGVSFYGIDGCSVTAFHDSHMVARSIMLPVKKDDRTGTWHTTCPLPSSLVLKPVLPVRTNRKFWHRTALNESCLVCTPGHETGTPFLSLCESPPRPELLAAFVPQLAFRNGHKLPISKKSGKQSPARIIPKHMGYILWIAIT